MKQRLKNTALTFLLLKEKLYRLSRENIFIYNKPVE